MSTPLRKPSAVFTVSDLDPASPDTGTATLSLSTVPYGEADVTVPLVDVGILDDLDEDMLAAVDVRGVIEAAEAVTDSSREFDLSVRSRRVSHDRRSITYRLATDEAILQKYQHLAKLDLVALAGSLRDVIDAVLDIAIPGAALEAGDDADVTPLWAITNLLTNPLPASTTGFTVGPGAGTLTAPGGTAVGWLSTVVGLSTLFAAPANNTYRVSPGKSYVFALEHSAAITTSSRAGIQWRTAGGGVALSNVFGAFSTSTDASYSRRSIVAVAPPGAEFAIPLIETSGNAVNTPHQARLFMFYEGDRLVDYFSGATTDTTQYSYEWTNAVANASASSRTPLVDAPVPDALVLQPDQSAWDFLEPLAAAVGRKIFCDEQRKWRLIDPADYSIGGLVSVGGWNASEGEDVIDRDSAEDFVTSVVVRFKWTDGDGIQQEHLDIAGVPGSTLTVERAQPFPGTGIATAILGRRAGRGRSQSATVLTDYAAQPYREMRTDLPGTSEQVGQLESVRWDLKTGFMQLSALGLADAGPDTYLGTDPELDYDDVADTLDWEDA